MQLSASRISHQEIAAIDDSPSRPFCETLAPPSLPLTVPGPPPTPHIMQLSASRIFHHEIAAIDDINIPIRTIDGINAEIRGLEDEISGDLDKYAQKNTLRNMLLATCAAADGGVLAAVCSGQKMKELLGCASGMSTLILSGILSATFIVSFAHVFYVQSGMLNHAEQLYHQRDSLVDTFLPDETLAVKRRFYSSYGKKEFESASATWWLPRALFLAVLTAISACLSISSARLLC